MPMFLCNIIDPTCQRPNRTVPVYADKEAVAAEVVGTKLMKDGECPNDLDHFVLELRRVADPEGACSVLRTGHVTKFQVGNSEGSLHMVEIRDRERVAAELTREELVAVVSGVVRELYHEGKDTAWDAGTLTEVADVLKKYNLVPLE